MLFTFYHNYKKYRAENQQNLFLKKIIKKSHFDSYIFTQYQPTEKDIAGHYKKFKPTLDRIKLGNFRLLNKNQFKNLIGNNINALFNKPFDMGVLTRYYGSILPTYRTMPLFLKYNAALNKLGNPSRNLLETSDYFYENQGGVYDIFEDSRLTRVEDSGNMEIAAELVSRRLSHLSNDELRILLEMIKTNELFGLVTIQPYMTFILGNLLFFNVFLPLHRKGAFLLFMQNCVSKQQSYRNSYYLLTYNVSRSIFLYTLPLAKSQWFKYGTLSSLTLSLSAYLFSLYLNKPIVAILESTFFRESVTKFLGHGVGLKNEYIDFSIDFLTKLSFDIGSFIGGMTNSFYRGIISRYTDVLQIAAAAIDKNASSRGRG